MPNVPTDALLGKSDAARVVLICLAVVSVSFSLHAQAKPPTQADQITSLQREVKRLAAEVSALKRLSAEVRSLQDDLKTMRSDVFRAELDIISLQGKKELWLDPTNPKGYQKLDTDVASFLVSLSDASPYLDGYKVKLSIGNPSTADFNGFEVKAAWGKRLAPGADYAAWKASLQERTFSMPETLRSGAWNPVEFVLAPAKADSMGTIRFSINVNTVGFR